MATGDPYNSRLEGVGLGIEATPGVAVAPQVWMRWRTNELQPTNTIIENDSAMGRIERVNDSASVGGGAAGQLGGKVTSDVIGYLLLGMYGAVSSSSNGDGTYTHAYSVNPSSIAKTLTTTTQSPIQTKRHPSTVFENLEISAERGGWVEVSTAALAHPGTVVPADTMAFPDEDEFTAADVTVKMADSVANLDAADLLKARIVKLIPERSSERDDALGTKDAPDFDRGDWEVKGELTLKLRDTVYEENFIANTARAFRVTMSNGDTTLTFTAPKTRIRELSKSRSLGEIVTVTLSLYFELDASTGETLTPTLTNTTSAYVAA
ncbi:MAG: phage tail tube protein [Ornithinimicrobium sp.]